MTEPYKTRIESRIHGSLRGFKKSPGSDLLAQRLQRLDERGLGGLVHSFIRQMGRQDRAWGLLVEINLADSLVMSDRGTPLWNRQDGCATAPCDITLKEGTLRADFQCKAILNAFNEMWIKDFLAWVEKRYAKREPGLLLDFASVLGLGESEFRAFKAWFCDNEARFVIGQAEEWRPIGGARGISLSFSARDRPGIARIRTRGAANDYGDAVFVSQGELPKKLLNCCNEARRTFGFAPQSRQFNFAVADLSAISGTFDQEDIFEALYGTRRRAACAGRLANGIFINERIDWVSAVIVPMNEEYAIYPHPSHEQAVRSAWGARPPFRLGRATVA
ncbi:MAG: hypothetical protein HYR64_10020 [Fimbriimonas ginsengisoli]|uniref:Uncharacterized protein n=1 Tax=Fimbriimonas ginsengisoli TaxID=1005039 RepID=A0A931LU82_FIMGI|nr:hypothetical protein [Fimbriimonas ginsengisoli]